MATVPEMGLLPGNRAPRPKIEALEGVAAGFAEEDKGMKEKCANNTPADVMP
jgi:hypothetical protein